MSTDLLKRDLAPILPQGWKEIDEEARRVLRLELCGRRLVDVEGPFGWDLAAVNRGRLDLLERQPAEGVHLGLRRVQPLLEFRTPFRLELMELDCVARGAKDPELEPVAEAARRAASVEDRALFDGLDRAGIRGIVGESPHDGIPLGPDGEDYPRAVVLAAEVLRGCGIGGPYALALDPRAYAEIEKAADDGYPIRRRVERAIDGPILRAPAIEGAVLLSVRGGDFLLTLGQDLSIGYAHHDRDSVELYLTESFTFQVLEPAAAVPLRHASTK
jgi:uncharacterized linocin/CFP29 family protein